MDYLNSKTFIYLILPLIVSYAFIKIIFGLHLWQVFGWWLGANGRAIGIVVIPVTILSALLLFYFVSGVMNYFYIAKHGGKYEVVYLGNKDQVTSVYYDSSLQGDKIYEGGGKPGFNSSFKHVNKGHIFIKKPNAIGSGVATTRLSVWNLVSITLALIAFAVPFFWLIFFLASPPYIVAHPELIEITPGLNYGYADLIEKYALESIVSLSIGIFIVSLIAAFSIRVYVIYMPAAVSEGYALPMNLRSGNTVKGVPLSFEIITSRERKNLSSSASARDIDTGTRRVTFRFGEGFQQPVFVTMYYLKSEFPQVRSIIERYISTETALEMQLMMNWSLSL